MAAVQPIRLQPSTAWNVNYAENSCRLSRAFGDGSDAIVLSLESEAPGQADMFVLGKALKTYSDKVSGKFLPVQAKPMEGHTAQSPFGTAVLWSRVRFLPDDLAEKYEKREKEATSGAGVRPPAIDLAQKAETEAKHMDFAAKVTELEVDARSGHPLILETGSLGAPIKAFDKCSRNSSQLGRRHRRRGQDRPAAVVAERPAMVHPGRLSAGHDGPWPAVGREGQAAGGATGRVTQCTSLSHFKEKSFDQIVCDKFMKRAHFEPAELADERRFPVTM